MTDEIGYKTECNKNVKRDLAITLAKRNLVDSIWKSAVIEGLGTTFPKTEMILENLEVTTTREEVSFIVNMKHAWQFILNTLDVEVDLMYLRQLNTECGRGLIYGCGQLRNINVEISGTDYIPPLPEADTVAEDLTRLQGIINPIDRAVEFFCYLTKRQLFIDSSKRLAQLVTNKVLIDGGVGILSIKNKEVSRFKSLLVSYYEDDTNKNTLTDFLREQIIYVQEPSSEEKSIADGLTELNKQILKETSK